MNHILKKQAKFSRTRAILFGREHSYRLLL
jgi:hypothetical protein